MKTSKDNVFAAGDVTTAPKTVVAAIADGKKAAAAVHGFITGKTASDPAHPLGGLLTFDSSCTSHSHGARLPERPKEERSLHLEDSYGLTWEQVQEEAKRCFNCGCLAVNPSDVATVLTAMDAEIITTARREKLAEEAAEIALSGALPLSKNAYKVQIAKTLVRNSLLNAR